MVLTFPGERVRIHRATSHPPAQGHLPGELQVFLFLCSFIMICVTVEQSVGLGQIGLGPSSSRYPWFPPVWSSLRVMALV